MEELPRLKSQQISSYASPPEPFDFPSEIAGLPGQTKQFYMEEVVQMGTPILYLLVTFCFVSVRF